jgi:glycosyltransferase involved in cell wall biosynthesis
LLFVGRFQAQKNLQWMIQQIGELRKRCLHPFAVDLVGDGPHLAMLQSTVRALQLDSCVNFHGWEGKEALRAHYRAAGLVVNPSLYEGMPNVVLEAMSCGRAVLASKVPGNDSLVVDGNTGWLFPLGDGESFRARIAAFLDNPDIVVALGDAARERAEKEYSWKETARSYLNLLDSPTPGFLS